MGTHKLKGLQVRLSKAKAEKENQKEIVKDAQRKLSELNKKVKYLKSQINAHKKKEITVNEHDLIRYFERVEGYNLEEIKNEILSEKIKEFTDTLGGDGTFPNEKGYKVLMKNNTVTTITT